MKKIINGKTYDTEKAAEVFVRDNGVSGIGSIKETLYRKRTGEFFLHGEGGADTKYAEQDGSAWKAGSAITPMSFNEAKEWAEEYMPAEEYEVAFESADEGKRVVNFVLDAADDEDLKRIANYRWMSKSDLLREIVAEAIENGKFDMFNNENATDEEQWIAATSAMCGCKIADVEACLDMVEKFDLPKIGRFWQVPSERTIGQRKENHTAFYGTGDEPAKGVTKHEAVEKALKAGWRADKNNW